MTSAAQVRVEDILSCYLCGNQGAKLYEALPDRVFGSLGKWDFLRCPQCGLVWLNPRPVAEDIGMLYATYYTHSAGDGRSSLAFLLEKIDLALFSAFPGYDVLAPGVGWKYFGRVLSLFPPMKEGATVKGMCLDGIKKGRLLDVGCGNGRFLALMRDAGWEVLGVDTDPVSAKIAGERYGISIMVGTVGEAGLPDESFDAVTLSHIIEHVYDPIALLRECRRVLKPGGRVVVATPNVESMGHRDYGEYWRGLEPPRHLNLFSLRTLRTCAAKSGLHVKVLRTSASRARFFWTESHKIKGKGRFSDSKVTWRIRIQGLAFRAREHVALRASEGAGEELILVATRC